MNIQKRLDELQIEFDKTQTTRDNCIARLSEIHGAYVELKKLIPEVTKKDDTKKK